MKKVGSAARFRGLAAFANKVGADVVVLGQGRGSKPRIVVSMTKPRHPLSVIARKVFLNRNASGMPEAKRAHIKAAALPHLRSAIQHVRQAKRALVAGEPQRSELLKERARVSLATAYIYILQPYMAADANRISKVDPATGGRAKRDNRLPRRKRFDELLKEILLACFAEGKKPRFKKLAQDHELSISTIYARWTDVRTGRIRN